MDLQIDNVKFDTNTTLSNGKGLDNFEALKTGCPVIGWFPFFAHRQVLGIPIKTLGPHDCMLGGTHSLYHSELRNGLAIPNNDITNL